MRLSQSFMFLGLAALMAASPANATLIVDTGSGDANGGVALDTSQWLAAGFTLTSAMTITGIEGWIRPLTTGDVSFVIYGDGGNIPDTGAELSRTTTLIAADSSAAWHGVDGLSLALGPGDYWVAYEVLAPSTFVGGAPLNSPFPLVDHAFFNSVQWVSGGFSGLGVRIYDDAPSPAVPEPATMALMGMGLAGLAGRMRKRKAA